MPGSSLLLTAVQALGLHWATGQSSAEDARLATQLAWIDPPSEVSGMAAARAGAWSAYGRDFDACRSRCGGHKAAADRRRLLMIEIEAASGRRRSFASISVALFERLMPDALSPATSQALARAESPGQGLALLLASPEFLRR